MNDNYYIKQTLLKTQEVGDRDEIPVGAVVVCKGRVIARAHDLTGTLAGAVAHAGTQAITAAVSILGGKYLSECTLYVTVGPCVMYVGAITWTQTGHLVFGAEDEKREYQRCAPHALHPETVVVKGMLGDERATLMKNLSAGKRR